jgi:ParB-like nuclease domain
VSDVKFNIDQGNVPVGGEPGEREGLPRGYRMRADAHYVEQLSAPGARMVRMISTREIDSSIPSAPDLEPLVQSIRAHGILHPLLVRRNASRYSIIGGRRRLAAAQLAGLSVVPCLIHQVDDSEAELLARAQNLTASQPVSKAADAVDLPDAVRKVVNQHLSIVAASADLAATDAPATARTALDLLKTHAWRAARLLDALDLIANICERPSRGRSLASIVDQVIDGFGPECRLSGVTLRAQIDNAPAVFLNDYPVFAGLSGAVLAMLPLVERAEAPIITLKVSTAVDSVLVEIIQTAVPVPAGLAARFFTDTSSDRAGGWSAVTGAMAVKALAERHGGTATFEAGSQAGGSIRVAFLRNS